MLDIKQEEVNQTKIKKIGNYVTISTFLFILMGLSLLCVLKPDKEFSENENRVLASKPSFSLDYLLKGSYTGDYETYVTDQFVARDQFIAMKGYTELALGKKVVNGVYFAPKNHLIEEHRAEDIDRTLASTNLQKVKEFIDTNKDSYPIHLMLVPTISGVYPEWLPDYNIEYDQSAFLKQAKDTIGEETFIDASNSLKKNKQEYIFNKTDHHWTSLGAYYGYIDWANARGLSPYALDQFARKVVATDFWGSTYSKVNIKKEADSIELFSLKKGPKVSMSLKQDGSKEKDGLYDMERLKQKDKYTVFLGGNNPYVKIHTSIKNGKTLLVMKDSYAHCMVPFLTNHYEKIILLDYRYFNKSTKRLMKEEKVSDILILYNVYNFISDTNLVKINK